MSLKKREMRFAQKWERVCEESNGQFEIEEDETVIQITREQADALCLIFEAADDAEEERLENERVAALEAEKRAAREARAAARLERERETGRSSVAGSTARSSLASSRTKGTARSRATGTAVRGQLMRRALRALECRQAGPKKRSA